MMLRNPLMLAPNSSQSFLPRRVPRMKHGALAALLSVGVSVCSTWFTNVHEKGRHTGSGGDKSDAMAM